jgi:ferredoxin
MEQNANNRLLNEEELEKVGGGAFTEYKEYTDSFFTCIHCGSHTIRDEYEWADPVPGKVDVNLVQYCAGCGRPLEECKELGITLLF